MADFISRERLVLQTLLILTAIGTFFVPRASKNVQNKSSRLPMVLCCPFYEGCFCRYCISNMGARNCASSAQAVYRTISNRLLLSMVSATNPYQFLSINVPDGCNSLGRGG